MKKSLTLKRPPTISVVMMAKNEEQNIERCLKSIQGIANEIILIDTGSTDKTNEIAEKYQAKIYNHPWEDNFSKHRNQSLSYAKGDWVMVIDCDEEAVFPEGKKLSDLKHFLRQLPKEVDAVSLTLKDVQQGQVHVQYNVPKFFRRGTVQYQGIVHNEPIHPGGLAHYPSIFYYHYGYDLNNEAKQKKIAKIIRLLKKRIETDKDDYQAYFYMAETLGWNDDQAGSVEYAEKYLKYSGKPDFAKCIYFMASLAYMKLNDKKNADKWLLAGLKRMPDNLDLLYALVEFGLLTGNPHLISKGARNFIKQYESFEDKQAQSTSFTFSYTPEVLAFCTYHLAILQMQEGALRLQQIGDIISSTGAEFQSDLKQKIDTFLHSIGLQQYQEVRKAA